MSADRLVIDTNVLISAALLQDSVPARLLQRALRCGRLVFSQATFEELQSRLWRPKFDRYISMEQRKLLLHDLGSVADWIEPALSSRHSRDADDDKFVHVGLASGARWLISGDRDLLDLRRIETLQVLSPASALRTLWPAQPG